MTRAQGRPPRVRQLVGGGIAAGLLAATLTTLAAPAALERAGDPARAADPSSGTSSGVQPAQVGSWVRSGSTYVDGSKLVLTTDQPWRNGSAFAPAATSSAGLDVRFTSYQGGGTGGYGLTLTLLDAAAGGPSQLGRPADGQGFAGLRGVAVSLDTSYSGPGDVNDTFLGIADGGTEQALHYLQTQAAIRPLRGAPRQVRVTYGGGVLKVWLDTELEMTRTMSLPPSVYVGFTAATGTRHDLQYVDSVAVGHTSAATAAPAAARLPLGAYVHSGDAAAMDRFAGWLGRRPEIASDVLPDRSWAALVAPPGWMTSAWRDRYRVALAVPMLPRDGSTIQRGATGAYDEQWRTLARNLVAAGLADADLRLGWEFNGDWQRWSSATDPASFRAYWRHVVTAMRSVSGARFSYDWNLNAGYTAGDAAAAYPGDDVVDVIGIQAYDVSWQAGTYPIPGGSSQAAADDRRATAWAALRDGPLGLLHWIRFAEAHGKPVAYPEWGLSDGPNGGGDDPLYVDGMYSLMTSHRTAYASYFNVTGSLGDSTISSGRYPRAAARFRALLG